MYLDYNTSDPNAPYNYVTNQLFYGIDEDEADEVCAVRNEPGGATPQKECTPYTTSF